MKTGNGMRMRGQPLAVRIAEHTVAVPFSGCWLWTGAINNKGYGLMTFDGCRMLAHRASFVARHGDIPPSVCVLHDCDVPACCNPDHLHLGDQRTNMREAAKRGRIKTIPTLGERHHRAKLSDAQVAEIRAASGTLMQVGKEFGVSYSTISRIRLRKGWRHI